MQMFIFVKFNVWSIAENDVCGYEKRAETAALHSRPFQTSFVTSSLNEVASGTAYGRTASSCQQPEEVAAEDASTLGKGDNADTPWSRKPSTFFSLQIR